MSSATVRQITFCTRGLMARNGQRSPSRIPRCLELNGFEVTKANDDPGVVNNEGILWLQSNAAWYPKIWRELQRMKPERRPATLVWHQEPLPPPRSSGIPYPWLNLREIGKILLRDIRATDVYTNWFALERLHRVGLPDVLVVSAPGRQQFLAERGIPSQFVPVGYSEEMGRDLGIARDIDVLFLGTLDVPRRNRLLEALRKQGIAVMAVGDWKNPAYWGEQRTQLLNRTKILLNFPRTRAEYSGMRILLGLANKALVISETMVDPTPYVPGRHFVMAEPEEMPDLIRYYLRHEEERRAIVEEGHRFALSEQTMERGVARILALATSSMKEGARLGKATVDSGSAHIRA